MVTTSKLGPFFQGYFGSQPIIDGDGSVKFSGLDFEGRKLSVHFKTDRLLVIKVTGGSGWASIGERAYHGAKFIVMARESEDGPWHDIVTFPLRKEERR